MVDKNKKEIKVGDLIKKCGYVRYADGDRWKVSKKTWVVSKIDSCSRCDGECEHPYYVDENGNDVRLSKKDAIEFLVVGDTENGYIDDYKPLQSIEVTAGSVEENYEVLKEVKEKGWKVGDIVKIIGKVDDKVLQDGFLKVVPLEKKHKHILIVVDPIKMGLKVKKK